MAKVTITATRTVEQTKTVEVKVRIGDVKAWMKDEGGYGSFSEDEFTWHDPQVLEEYFQDHEDLTYILGETKGNVDESPDDWEVQYAEEM